MILLFFTMNLFLTENLEARPPLLIMGFQGVSEKDPGVQEMAEAVKKGYVQGVILFSYNIQGPEQLKALIKFLKSKGCKIIAIDQEGGKVSRLRASTGFKDFPSAYAMTKLSLKEVRNHYAEMAALLKEVGINFVFAPCVDLDKGSPVISGLERSYGNSPAQVIKYAEIFLEEFKKAGVKTCLKHFSGHTDGDTHQGIVVKKNWAPAEIIPYQKLKADGIMISHTINCFFDSQKPESFSPKVIQYLREKLKFKGQIIMDDGCMGALLVKYSLEEIVRHAIQAGNTILLFGRHIKAFDVMTIDEEEKKKRIAEMEPQRIHALIQKYQFS